MKYSLHAKQTPISYTYYTCKTLPSLNFDGIEKLKHLCYNEQIENGNRSLV